MEGFLFSSGFASSPGALWGRMGLHLWNRYLGWACFVGENTEILPRF